MAIDWVELSKGDYEEMRAALWPRIEPQLPESGSILDGGVDNLIARTFGSEWRLPHMSTTDGDLNQIKIYRSALRGEIEKELNNRRLETYQRVYAAFQELEETPRWIQSGQIIAMLEDLGIELNSRHRKELRHYVKFRAAREDQQTQDQG